MTDKNLGVFEMSQPVPMLFPALAEARAYQDKGKDVGAAKFGATFLFPTDHADLKALKKTAFAVATAKWGAVDAKDIAWPFSSGTEYAAKRTAAGKDGSVFVDKSMLKSQTIYEPKLSWVTQGKLSQDIPSTQVPDVTIQTKFFSGAEVLASFKFVPVEVSGRKFVTAYLDKVLSTGKGQRQGGVSRSASESFASYIGQLTQEDPTAGDDEPF